MVYFSFLCQSLSANATMDKTDQKVSTDQMWIEGNI